MYEIELDETVTAELDRLFRAVGTDCLIIKHMIGFVDGRVRAEVRADEHPPPHFHIRYDGEDASYDIETGLRLPNVRGLERYDHVVHLWWKRNRVNIVKKWNSSRPTDCPVGEMKIPSNWH